MDSLKKKITYENLLYLILLISPFLDILAFLFRSIYPNSVFSPATVLRPLIPLAMLVYIFLKDKKFRWSMIFASIIYIIYGFMHMHLYEDIIRGISFGNFYHEFQYIVNYTYMIGILFLFYYGYSNYKLEKLPKVASIVLTIYLISIYLSIITNTSSITYIEGIGYKGWFSSGNAIGSILLLLFCIFLPHIKNTKNKIFSVAVVLLLGYFLMALIGTRTGLFGFLLCIIAFILGDILIKIIKKSERKKNNHELLIFSLIVVLTASVLLIGSNTFKRQQNLDNMGNSIIDSNTGKPSHVTGDSLKIIDSIKQNKYDDSYMSEAQQKTMLELYNYANKHEIKATDRRILQLVYHLYLVKNQHNIFYILFGNGYLANYAEMTLEMEVPAIILNFGILGFALYLLPFVLINIWAIKVFFQKFKKVDIEYIMYLLATLLAFVLSFLAGYTFFNVSSMVIIVMAHILLIKKTKECS